MVQKNKYVYDWPRPMVTVDAIVFTFSRDTTKILLINRKNEPFQGKWALPGGFVGIEEELDIAVARELFEETGIKDVALEQIHTFGRPGRDPRGRQITIVYMGIMTKNMRKIKAGDDAKSVKWFDIKKLPKELAFDHSEIIKFAVTALGAVNSRE